MHGMKVLIAFGLASIAASGCSGSSSDEFTYGGDAAHFKVAGTFKGETVDVTMPASAAADTDNLSCSREYEVPGTEEDPDFANAVYKETQVRALLTVNGVEKRAEIEIKRHDLSATTVGSVVTIIPRVDGEDPSATEAWLDWEWHDSDTNDILNEGTAQDGEFTLRLFSGVEGGSADMGPIIEEDTGYVGGVIDARWSPTEHLQFSFSALCVKNKLEFEE